MIERWWKPALVFALLPLPLLSHSYFLAAAHILVGGLMVCWRLAYADTDTDTDTVKLICHLCHKEFRIDLMMFDFVVRAVMETGSSRDEATKVAKRTGSCPECRKQKN